MIKSRSFKDTQLLMTMFLNNALKGFLNRPIFKSKWVRRSFVTFLCLLYILYYLYNMKELAKISSIRTNVPLAILETGQKQIFFSYFSNTVVLGCLSFLFVEATLALDKTSLYFVKALPFRRRDVQRAYSLFRLVLMIGIYELVMIIATPAIKLVTTFVGDFGLFFLSQHFSFIIVIISLEILSLGLDLLLQRQMKHLLVIKLLLANVILIISLAYFFQWRYALESRLASSPFSIHELILGAFLVSLSCLIIAVYLLLHLPLADTLADTLVTSHSRFIKVPVLDKVTFRYKTNWYYLIFPVIVVGIIAYQSGRAAVFAVLPTLLAFNGLLLLSHGDSTEDFRHQYNLLRITVWEEYFRQYFLLVLLEVPLLICYGCHLANINQVMVSIAFAQSALMLGYLFPKSRGNLNETTSMFLLGIVFILVTLVVKNASLGLITIILLAGIHYSLLRRLRYERF
ncbi:hypothetical protein [Streptococcus sp. UBA4344]|uniref:hypothetical protein n=1 Tax=Streptococcus sp. UBA4344 TaxID=1947564 RepID=UPI002579A713|nr:hypothetical protein [Streptococcus sp. UBA4344]